MSTVTTQSAASLNGSQRDWLVRMGALLNAPVRSASGSPMPLGGGPPEAIWEKMQAALSDANMMVLDMDEANLSKVPVFKKGIALARSFADQKKFAEAVQTFAALEPKIKEEFEKFQTSRGGGVQAKGGGADAAGAPSGPPPKGGETHPDDDPKAAEYKKQVLKVGSKGPAVEYLQKKLNLTGAKLEVDGKFGPATEKAVKAFQKSKQLKDDGIVGEKTWAALDGATPKPDPPKPDTKPRKAVVIVTNSSTNDAVKGATVQIGTKSEKTGNTGQATLDLPPGKYPYGVAADGFEQAIGTFEVTDKETSELRVELKGGAKPTASTTVLTANPANQSNKGDKLVLTATVEFGPGKPALIGTVRFDAVLNEKGGRQKLAIVPIQNGKAVHTETLLPPGKHLLDALFEPDPNNKGSQSAPLKHTIIDSEYTSLKLEVEKSIAELKKHAQSENFKKEITAIEAKFADAQKKHDANQEDAARAQLKSLKFECTKTKTSMDLVAGGTSRARADQVADISQSLVDTGVDPVKALEVGQLTQTGGHGDTKDAKLVAQKLAKLPLDVIKSMRAKGTKVVSCRDNITDEKPELKGETPRGWDNGETWDKPGVPGVFMPDDNEVIIATRGHGTPGGPQVPAKGNGHGSYDLATHESMHGYDHNGGGTPKHDDKAFQDARKKDYSKLGKYYTQPGDAGLEETYAESAARYYGGDPKMKTDWPNLYAYWDSQKK